ncbi:MAG: ribonuclease E activity regulator RraA [Burkholderiales bacterium]|nr:ribonuclease E activity regulator RraA [Burkholderiales bacterium]
MNTDANPSTCDLCDAHKSDSSGALRVLPPVFHSYGGRRRFAGALSTVQCLDDNSRVKEAVNTPGLGRVLLVDAGGTVRRSMVGGQLAQAAAKNGWAGLVIWGAVRDKAELAAADVGLYALALQPMPTDRKDQGLRDVPVQIDGLPIRPGEYLVADEDGIVVLPARP